MRTKLIALLSVLVLAGLTAGTSTADVKAPPERTQVAVPQPATTRHVAGQSGPGFAIHSTATNQCLAAAGTAVVLADCAYEPAQRWYFHDLGDSNYVVRNGDGGVLEADLPASCCNGAALRVAAYLPGDANQQWLYWNDGSRHGLQNNYSYRNLAAGDGEVRLWDYRRDDAAQLWWLELAE